MKRARFTEEQIIGVLKEHEAGKVHRQLQTPRGPGDRGQGHPPGRPSLGVPRPSVGHGHPPDPRLPGPLAQVVRWPRQLHVRRDRAAHLPRGRLRQHRHDPGHGHHHRHYRPHRRGGLAPSSLRSGSPSVRRTNSTMAKKALVEKQQRTPKFKVRGYTRCRRCGRPKSVYRKFGLCRICLRVMVHAGEVPGVTKASW